MAIGALVVMAKAPRAGHVKTRLSRDYPAETVVELYRCLLADTLALALSLPGVRVAVMAPSDDLSELAPLLPVDVIGVAQRGEGLADALASVFTTFCPEGPRRVIAFNSDSPQLPAHVLATAFDMLLTRDLVVGPTDDGGYYLVGATRAHAGLFDPAPMGTGSALASLLASAGARGLTYGLTEKGFDIDLAGDLTRLSVVLHRRPSSAPRTAAFLLCLGQDEVGPSRPDREHP